MRLIVGGCYQGKFEYAINTYGIDKENVYTAALPKKNEVHNTTIVINKLNEIVKMCLKQGDNPEEMIMEFVEKYPDSIIISDEIGNGIVPMDKFEREYRECTGRLLITLAKEAESVERVICGISQRIK